MLAETGLTEIEVEDGDRKIRVSRGGGAAARRSSRCRPPAAALPPPPLPACRG
jgi:acetyl-CoA carboxylase biotin carboxyl carrier protein